MTSAMLQPRVFAVSYFAPSIVGHGGTHRTFQLEHDATEAFGAERFASVNFDAWRAARSQQPLAWPRRKLRGIRRRARIVTRRLAMCLENPMKVVPERVYATAVPFSPQHTVEPEFVAHYAELVRKYDGPKVCVLEHVIFGPIVEVNAALGIPTISAFQNLEALDVTRFNPNSRKNVYTVMADLGNELRLLGRCADRLAISKVEAGFVGGLGLGCHYYPYLPVGELRESLRAIRRRKLAGETESGLIVLLGSAVHGVTGESMRWFVDHAREHGLPSGARVVAVGLGTDALLPPGESVAGFEPRGWLDQSDLDALLARASAAVIPQRLGFGAVTRLPELACAGLPVIAFSHSAHAINPTPGLRIVAQDWQDLCAAMREHLATPVDVVDGAYDRWEMEQPRPLATVLRRAIECAVPR